MPQPLPKRRKIIWPDKTYYFITNSTYLHYPYFKNEEQKQIVLSFFKTLQLKHSIPIQDFAILMTHFHLIFYAEKGETVGFVKRFLKNNISREYRKIYQVPYKEFWHSTRVLWIKDEKTLLAVRGYIIGNLLKHKEVSNFQELFNNPFSSFKYFVEKQGLSVAQDLIFRVIKTEEGPCGEIEINNLNRSQESVEKDL